MTLEELQDRDRQSLDNVISAYLKHEAESSDIYHIWCNVQEHGLKFEEVIMSTCRVLRKKDRDANH